MIVYAEIEVPASSFTIGEAFSAFDDVTVELDRIVPAGDAVIPFIWVQGAEPEAVIEMTLEREAVERITMLTREKDGKTLYRIVWNRRFRDTIIRLSDANISLLSGTGSSTVWRFEVRATSKRAISEFLAKLRAEGIETEIRRLKEVDSHRDADTPILSDDQREALLLAYARGYFEEPRHVHQEALAQELDITRQAFSGRLRRGVRNLVAETLIESEW